MVEDVGNLIHIDRHACCLCSFVVLDRRRNVRIALVAWNRLQQSNRAIIVIAGSHKIRLLHHRRLLLACRGCLRCICAFIHSRRCSGFCCGEAYGIILRLLPASDNLHHCICYTDNQNQKDQNQQNAFDHGVSSSPLLSSASGSFITSCHCFLLFFSFVLPAFCRHCFLFAHYNITCRKRKRSRQEFFAS